MSAAERIQNQDLDELKETLAGLREEVAGLSATVRRSSRIDAEQEECADEPGCLDCEEETPGAWSNLVARVESSAAHGRRVVRGLAADVEARPLISVAAAFGIGYLIAKLWHQRSDS